MKLETLPLNFNVIDILKESGLIHFATHTVLRAAEENGGYVGGGFAFEVIKVILRHRGVLSNTLRMELNDLRVSYLGTELDLANYHKSRKDWKASHGDIDVWFSDKDSYEDFSLTIDQMMTLAEPGLSVNREKSPAGFATDYVCYTRGGQQGQIIQTIHKFFGEKQEVLDDFDIVNASCCFSKNEIMYPELFVKNQLSKMIYVNDKVFNCSVRQINRLFKWKKKHQCDGYSNESLVLINERFDNLIDSISTEAEQNKDRYAGYSDEAQLEIAENSKYINRFLSVQFELEKYLSLPNLLKLSMISNPRDNPAMNELKIRAGVQKRDGDDEFNSVVELF